MQGLPLFGSQMNLNKEITRKETENIQIPYVHTCSNLIRLRKNMNKRNKEIQIKFVKMEQLISRKKTWKIFCRQKQGNTHNGKLAQ